MRSSIPAWPVLLLLLALPAAPAAIAQQQVVIYRCTDASGALTIQNDVPCPDGSRQKKQVIDAPPAIPAYQPRPEPTPVAAPTPAPASQRVVAASDVPAPIDDAERLPPPLLFRCNTYDNDSYLSEQAQPPPRCIRLQTTSLDGAGPGAGMACQMVTDQCQRIADGEVCAAWQQRGRETQAAWTFARAENVDTNRAEHERVQKILRESTCGR